MTLLSRPLHRSEHTGSRGGIPAMPICTTSSPQKRSLFLEKRIFLWFYEKTNAHSRTFFPPDSDSIDVDEGSHRCRQSRAPTCLREHRAAQRRIQCPRGRPITAGHCGPTRPNIDSPDRAACIDFCECLRSVKQSRRLNLQCSQPYALRCLSL